MAGTLRTVDFVRVRSPSAGRDIFVAKFDSQLNPVWSRGFPGAGNEDCFDVFAGAQRVVVVGAFTGTVNFGGGLLVSAGLRDAYLLKLTSSGSFFWDERLGGANDDAGYAVAVGPAGEIVVAGIQNATGATSSAMLTRFRSDHTLHWTRSFDRAAHAVRIHDAAGSMWVGLRTESNNNPVEAFLRHYSSIGTSNSSRASAVARITRGIDMTRDGRLVIVGDEGGRPLVDRDLVQLQVMPGDFKFGSYNGVVCGLDDKTVGVGSFRGTAFGIASRPDSTDALVFSHRSDGAVAWAMSFGGPNSDQALDVAQFADGNLAVVGAFRGTADFGGFQHTSAGSSDIWITRIEVFHPILTDLPDVGNDEGGFIKLAFDRDYLDYAGSPTPVVEYEVFRRDGPLSSPTWTPVRTVPAHADAEYRVIAPTLANAIPTVFFVRAKTTNPALFYDSQPDSGVSLDNLAPAPPAQLRYADGVLSWSASTSADVTSYTVYGSTSPEHRESDEAVRRTRETSVDIESSRYAYYHVTAADEAGNESTPVHVGVSGDSPQKVYTLGLTAYPNPFNPETTIRFELPWSGRALLAIYDARGARVAVLADGVRDPGVHSVSWQGRDERGVSVSSGVYFARLDFGGETLNRKLVLMK
jgi:hypothetical protein